VRGSQVLGKALIRGGWDMVFGVWLGFVIVMVCFGIVFGPSEALLGRLLSPRCSRILLSRSMPAGYMGLHQDDVAADAVVDVGIAVRGIHCCRILEELGRRCWLVCIPTLFFSNTQKMKREGKKKAVKENPAPSMYYSRQHSNSLAATRLNHHNFDGL
jgi:hypothetical protein